MLESERQAVYRERKKERKKGTRKQYYKSKIVHVPEYMYSEMTDIDGAFLSCQKNILDSLKMSLI